MANNFNNSINSTVGSSNTGADNTLTVNNSDNTSTDSNAGILIQAGGTSGGDPFIRFDIPSGNGYVIGQDNSATGGAQDRLIIGVGGNDPSDTTQYFALNPGGAALFSGTQVTLSNANVGGNVLNKVTNTDDTNTASHAFVDVRAGGSSGGDAYVRYAVEGVLDYSWGIDNTDSDAMVLTNAATLNGTNFWHMTTAGERTLPLQPAFLGQLDTGDLNVTGAGAVYTLGAGTNPLTEIFDQGGDFVTTGTFTAPVTGRYYLAYSVSFGNLTAAMTFQSSQIVTSNRTYEFGLVSPASMVTVAVVPNLGTSSGSVLADMDASDTITVQITINGGAGDTADLSVSSARVFMCGNLAC